MELAFEQRNNDPACIARLRRILASAQEQTQELIIPGYNMPDASRTLICYAEPEVQSKDEPGGRCFS